MTCGEAKQALMDVVLEEAGDGERQRLEAHLKACEVCGAEFARLKLTRKLLVDGLPQEEIPRRIAFVSGEPSRRGVLGWFWKPAFALPVGLAAGIAVLACGLALAQVRLAVERGRWELAFGRAPVAAVTSAAVPQGGTTATPVAQALTREQALQLIAAAIRESELRQQRASATDLKAALANSDERHRTALTTVAELMRSFQATQSMFARETDQTRSELQLVASRQTSPKGEQP